MCKCIIARWKIHPGALLGAVAGMRLVGETKSEGLKSSSGSDLCVLSNSELLLIAACTS